MWAVDTNVLVRLITQDEPKQTAAARKLMAQGAWASLLVIGETLWVLANVYELDDAAQATAVESLLEQRSLVIQDADVVSAALARFRARPRLGLTASFLKWRAKPVTFRWAPSIGLYRGKTVPILLVS